MNINNYSHQSSLFNPINKQETSLNCNEFSNESIKEKVERLKKEVEEGNYDSATELGCLFRDKTKGVFSTEYYYSLPPYETYAMEYFELGTNEMAQNRGYAAQQLALLYSKDKKFDPAKVLEYLTKAVIWDNNDAINDAYNIGLQLQQKPGVEKKYIEECFQFAVDHGHLDALFALGNLYCYEWKKSLNYYEMAAQKGHIQSIIFLAECYAGEKFGFPSDQIDLEKALSYLESAANQGDLRSALELGYIFLNGKGRWSSTIYPQRDVNVNKAIFYFNLASQCDQFGDAALATLELGRIYRDGKGGVAHDFDKAKSYFDRLRLIPENPDVQALDLFLSAANHPESAYQVGKMFLNGTHGVSKDNKKCLEYFELAAIKGHAGAAFELGQIYRQGKEGINRDVLKMTTYFEKAVQGGYKGASTALGQIYLQGEGGINSDPQHAINLFERDIQLNHPQAHIEMGRLYKEGKENVDIDLTKAILHFQTAVDMGSIEAKVELGRIYRLGGKNVEIDLEKAKTLFYGVPEFSNDDSTLRLFFEANIELGCLYRDGSPQVPQSLFSAERFFSMAVKETSFKPSYAAHQLGLLLEKKQDYAGKPAPNHKEALLHLENAILWKSKEAVIDAYLIGQKYNSGQGVDQDKPIALKYFALAAKGDHLQATIEVCKAALAEGDWKLARKYMDWGIKLSANFIEDNFSQEFSKIGALFLYGIGGNVDQAKGLAYLTEASDRGSTDATLDLIAYHHREKNVLEKQERERHYRNLRLQELDPKFAALGAKLLFLANNSPQKNEVFFAYKPDFSETFRKKFESMASKLMQMGVKSDHLMFFSTAPNGGVCAAMVIDFISRFHSHFNHLPPQNDIEKQLLEIAQKYEYRSGMTISILQTIYQSLFDEMQSKPNGGKINESVMTPLYEMYGQRLLPLDKYPSIYLQSDAESISSWLNSANSDGNFHVYIKTQPKNGGHALAFFKRGGQVHIWDPNFGLISCPINKAESTIISFLSTHYPKIDNHNITLFRIEPLPVSVSESDFNGFKKFSNQASFDEENESPNGSYAILGVASNASKKEIRDAYKKLVLQYHPDKNRQRLDGETDSDFDKRQKLCGEKFMEISSAFFELNKTS